MIDHNSTNYDFESMVNTIDRTSYNALKNRCKRENMTTLKKLKPIFKFINKYNHRQVLSNILVDSEGLKCTDLETNLLIKEFYNYDVGLLAINTLGLLDIHQDNIDDFPLVDFHPQTDEYIETTLDIIKDIRQYSSNDETRPFLCGIAINNVHIVATDGHTLKAVKLKRDIDNYIIPNRGIDTLIKLCKLYKLTDIDIQLGDEFAIIDNDNFTLMIRLINKEFPAWKRNMPSSFEFNACINDWYNFKEIKPLFDTKNYACIIELKHEKVHLKVAGQSFLIGYCGLVCNHEIGFNGLYLDRVIGKGDNIFSFNNEISPCMINGVIVMPLKV